MRNRQGITIAALIVAIIGLSIGFAAFSNTLTIRSTASVNPSDENFVVKFSKISSDDQTGSSYPITPIIDNESDATGTNGIIDSSNPLLLTGLSAAFTEPGQSVSYKLYVRNTGSYTAYLTNLNFKNIAGDNKAKDCTGNDVTTSLKTAACNDISISVRIGSSDGVGGDVYTASNDNIQSDNTKTHKTLAAQTGYEEVYVTISYADNGNYIDGNMTVTFGDIMLQYRTVGTPLAIPDPVVEIPDYTDTFLSLEQGVLTRYLGDSTTPIIPNDLSLPVSTLSYTYDNTKCLANATLLGAEEGNEQDFCNENGKALFMDDEQLVPRTYQWIFEYGGGEETYSALDYFTNSSRVDSPQSYPITTIGDGAFRNVRDDMTSITIGDGITTIESYLFNEYSSLATVNIGSGITNIGDSAFKHIASNPSITIDRNVSQVILGNEAFDNGVTIHFNDNPNYVYGS